ANWCLYAGGRKCVFPDAAVRGGEFRGVPSLDAAHPGAGCVDGRLVARFETPASGVIHAEPAAALAGIPGVARTSAGSARVAERHPAQRGRFAVLLPPRWMNEDHRRGCAIGRFYPNWFYLCCLGLASPDLAFPYCHFDWPLF